MKAFERLRAVALPIAQPNLDTDQIIPARYLQKLRADDFGQYLFRDLRYRKDGTEDPGFLLNQPAYRDARVVVARAQLRLRIVARARRVGAPRLRHPRRDRAELRRHLPRRMRSRTGCCRSCCPPPWSAERWPRCWRSPGAIVEVDLEAQTVTLPDGSVHAFAIDPFRGIACCKVSTSSTTR